MKNNFSVLTPSNQNIRENRLKIKQNLKLSMKEYSRRNYRNQNTLIDGRSCKKTEPHLKVIKQVGLVEKEYIHGSFEDAFQLKEKIGEGAHATVYRCIQKSSGKIFAVKITKHSDEELIETSKVTFKILKSLQHENVMKAEAFYTDRVKLTTYLVCQLCEFPELGVHMRNRKNLFLGQAQATTIITSVLQTLQYLHKKGVCHRDIKPQNILYNPETKKIKLIDFDCAKNKKQSELKFEMWTKTGSINYQAPEFFQQIIYDQKVDIWATGIIAYELVTGMNPFKSSYYSSMVKMITKEQIEIDRLNLSEDFKNLLKKTLEKDPSKRFSAADCLRLPLFLKSHQLHPFKMIDDFQLQMTSTAHSSPRSYKKIETEGRKVQFESDEEKSPLLKFFCIVDKV